MTPAAALITGLVIALVAAALSIAYIWKVRESRFQTREGLRILSGMRWRELSNLVVDALAASGFVRETATQQSTRGAGDVHVYRDGRPWVLTCRQGVAHVVTRASVDELARSVRAANLAGGVLVTPGQVDASARDIAPNIEVVGGEELWKLVGPLLPASVHAEVAAHARARALRASGAALAIATVAGVAIGYAASLLVPSPEGDATVPAPVSAQPHAPRAPAAAATTTAPMSEDEEREAIVREIGQLPGVDKALWSTRSTLQVFLNDPTVANDAALCAVMKRYELLRSSRLQIQAPAGAERPVRFMQCAVY